MRIALSGSTGFVGSHLLRMLRAAGHEVDAIGRITKTSELCDRFKSNPPEIVIHLAALFISDHIAGNVQPLIDSNILFGTQLLEAMARCGCKRLINTGSFWQQPRPRNLYAATKTAFEAIAGYYRDAYGIHCVTLTLPDVYGPGDTRRKLVNVLRNANGERLPMLPANHLIDLVHVDDVCRAFVAAMDLTAGTWSISAGPTRLDKVVSEFQRCHGRPLNVGWGERSYRPRETSEPWVGSILPGWEPKVSLREGIAGLFA